MYILINHNRKKIIKIRSGAHNPAVWVKWGLCDKKSVWFWMDAGRQWRDTWEPPGFVLGRICAHRTLYIFITISTNPEVHGNYRNRVLATVALSLSSCLYYDNKEALKYISIAWGHVSTGPFVDNFHWRSVRGRIYNYTCEICCLNSRRVPAVVSLSRCSTWVSW